MRTRCAAAGVVILLGLGALVLSRVSVIEEHFPPGPPSVGLAWAESVTLTAASPVAARAVTVHVDPIRGRITTPRVTLAARSPGRDCAVPLDVRYRFASRATGDDASPPPDASAHVAWSLDARLELLGPGWIGDGELRLADATP